MSEQAHREPLAAGEPLPDGGDQAAVTALRRLHPATPVLNGWKWFALAVAAIGQNAVRDLNYKLFGLQVLAALVLGVVLGMFSWWFTKYRIEGEELRIESGFLFRRSRRIRIDRLQAVDIVRPVLARFLGVAELRLEVAGGGKTEAPLAYLNEPGAQQLRAELLARAAGLDADTPEAPEHQLVAVPPGVLLASTVVSAPFLTAVLGFVVVAIASVVVGEIVGLAFLLPWALGGLGVVWRQFVGEFGFTVSESPDGLRIRKGLLDTWAQTVPPGRVQGVEIEQQFLWRPKGWVKLSVDVAGYGGKGSEGQTSSTLLPVAPWPVARALLERVLPGVDVDGVARVRAPRRARWLRPIGWRYLRHGVDDRVFVSDAGWLTRRTAVVPHVKMQSVRVTQGPYQRLLGLASVHVDTPVGPVNAVALHRAPEVARDLVRDQAERSRLARRTAGPERWMQRRMAVAAVPPDAVAAPRSAEHAEGAVRQDYPEGGIRPDGDGDSAVGGSGSPSA
ncbi:PH domain-containing protein [Actinopolymorpha singaporensis]|uniref:Putative membrane protein n=1 Tax=Actinopolymorpha singaporensis TaxID=117157 RepID=A0A1H1QJU9_9ACTN|nr:PH domain-containing protein [Actinopolymorpha singaporensis]SDS23613.1 putative membrane protein [Actinopolymorpha singaporensis]